MKIIIEHGKKQFITTCRHCGCTFSYELTDIIGTRVECPECGSFCTHKEQPDKEEPSLCGSGMQLNGVPFVYADNKTGDFVYHCDNRITLSNDKF